MLLAHQIRRHRPLHLRVRERWGLIELVDGEIGSVLRLHVLHEVLDVQPGALARILVGATGERTLIEDRVNGRHHYHDVRICVGQTADLEIRDQSKWLR